MKVIAHIEVIRKEIRDMEIEHKLEGPEFLAIVKINNALDELEKANNEKLERDT